MNKTFELSREHEENNDDAQNENESERAPRLLEIKRLALVVDRRALRKTLPRQRFQIVERLAKRIAIGDVRLDRDGAHAVVAVEARGAGGFGNCNEIGERNQFAASLGTDEKIAHVARRALSGTFSLEDDVIFLPVLDIGRHETGPEYGLERPADISDRNTQIAGAVAVNLDTKLRLCLLVIVIDIDEAGIAVADSGEQNIAPFA